MSSIPSIIAHVDQSIEKALRGESQLTEKELAIQGFSTPTQRHLWNNLMSKSAMYVEAGLFGGATWIAAMKGNKDLNTVGIDDCSQNFGNVGIFDHLRKNIEEYKNEPHSMKFICEDFFEMNLDEHFGSGLWADCDTFYYDAVHSEEAQASALPRMLPYMRDEFTLLIDDADWIPVKAGTERAIESIKDQAKLMRRWDLTDGVPDGARYHNGIFIGVFKKIKDW